MHAFCHLPLTFVHIIMAIFQTKTGRWRVQIRRKSGAVDETYDTREEADARQALADGLPGGISFAPFVERYYLNSVSAFKSLSENSQSAYQARLVYLNEHFGRFSLSAIDARAASVYRDKRAPAASTSTVDFELGVLSAVLTHAVTMGYLPYNLVRPALKNLRSEPIRRTRRVSPAEIQRLLDGRNARLELTDKKGRPRALTAKQKEACRFFYVLAFLGCRAGELAALKPEDLNLRGHLYRSTLKGGNSAWRLIATEALGPLYEQVMELQGEHLISQAEGLPFKPAPYLFSTNGGPYQFKNAAATLRNAGVMPEDWYPHALRREFISSALESGEHAETIILATGHKHASSVQLYDVSAADSPARLQQLNDLYKARAKKLAIDVALTEQLVVSEDPWANLI